MTANTCSSRSTCRFAEVLFKSGGQILTLRLWPSSAKPPESSSRQSRCLSGYVKEVVKRFEILGHRCSFRVNRFTMVLLGNSVPAKRFQPETELAFQQEPRVAHDRGRRGVLVILAIGFGRFVHLLTHLFADVLDGGAERRAT